MVGLIHAYELTPRGVENRFGFAAAPGFGAMYALGAIALVALSRAAPSRFRRKDGSSDGEGRRHFAVADRRD